MNNILDNIFTKFNLEAKAEDRSVYIEVKKGMEKLLQGLLENQLFEERLNKHGYHQSKLVPGLRNPNCQTIPSTLAVDNF